MPASGDLRIAGATLAVAILAWPFPSLVPGVDYDWNWMAALAVASEQRLHFGSEIVWTYGPLGSVTLDTGALIYYPGTALIAFLYQWIVQLLLAATVFLVARRSYGNLAAFAIAFVVVSLVPDRAVALGFAWCALALLHGGSGRYEAAMRWFPLAIGVLVGVTLLSKVNNSIEMLALATLALSTRPGRRVRDAAIFAGAALATAGAGWLAAGQSLADLWNYAHYSVEIARSYQGVMGKERDDAFLLFAGAGAVFLIVSALVWSASRNRRGSARWGLVALWLLYAFFAFKTDFVREDHDAVFSGSALMVLAVMPVRPVRRLFGLVGIAACTAIFALSSLYLPLDRALNPFLNAKAAIDQTIILASSERRTAERARLVSEIRDHYDFPPAFAEAIGSRTVMFWPRVVGDLVYAYGFEWRPPPVFQNLAATPVLDELGARMLASPQAPELIVRTSIPPVDGRFGTFEAPATTRQIFCRYREVMQDGEWQLLTRSVDRCGSSRRIAVVTGAWREKVEVPAPTQQGSAVFVRIDGVNPAGVEMLEMILLRPRIRYVHLDDQIYRLVAATATDGLLVSAPRSIDYSFPFAMAPNPRMITVSRGGSEPSGLLTYTFFEVPICGGAAMGRERKRDMETCAKPRVGN